jgi:hypothetical protein
MPQPQPPTLQLACSFATGFTLAAVACADLGATITFHSRTPDRGVTAQQRALLLAQFPEAAAATAAAHVVRIDMVCTPADGCQFWLRRRTTSAAQGTAGWEPAVDLDVAFTQRVRWELAAQRATQGRMLALLPTPAARTAPTPRCRSRRRRASPS